jgi:hypothetical protein
VALQQEANRDLVLERLQKEAFQTVTMDFDGSVQSTRRHAEGTAVGYNKELLRCFVWIIARLLLVLPAGASRLVGRRPF